MMIQNAMLRKEIKDLMAMIDALELEQNRLQTIDQKCVSTKSDAKTYSTACRKVVYTCLEYQVPLTSIGPVVTAAIQELGGQIIDHFPDPSSFSNFTYELGIISDLQVGENTKITSHSLVILPQWMDFILMKHTLLFQDHHLHHMC